jgi:hypothetical protein
VKNWFTGPKTTIDLPEGVSAADEIALEHHGGGVHPSASTVTDTSPDDVPDRR